MKGKKKIITLGLVSIFLLLSIASVSANNIYSSNGEPILQIDNVENNPDSRTQITRSDTVERGSEETFHFTVKNVGSDTLYLLDIKEDWENKDKDGFISYWFEGDFPLQPDESVLFHVKYEITNELFQHKVQKFSISIANTDEDVHYPATGKYNQYILEFTINADGVVESKIIDNDLSPIKDIIKNRFPIIYNLFLK